VTTPSTKTQHLHS